MANISEIKDAVNTKTLNLVLLTLVTGGIYLILYVNRHASTIANLTDRKVSDETYVIWLAVCFGLSSSFDTLALDFDLLLLSFIPIMLSIAYSVLAIVWSFKARAALQEYALTVHKVDLRMNAVYTILFPIIYVNYCINDLPEDERKQRILNTRED